MTPSRGADVKRQTNEELFGLFWKAYPRRIGKGKARIKFVAALKGKPYAEKVALTEEMIASIKVTQESPQWRKDNGAFIPFPATWLFQERREDDEYQSPDGVFTTDGGLAF